MTESPESELQQLTTTRLSSWLQRFSAKDTSATLNDIQGITWCYKGPYRKYHSVDHAIFMGQEYLPPAVLDALEVPRIKEQATAITAFSGYYHDAAYKHVDGAVDPKEAWPKVLVEQIGTFVRFEKTEDPTSKKAIFTTFLTDAGKADRMTRLVADIYGVTDAGLTNMAGSNEFDSALAAAKFLEKRGANDKTILAVVTAIAGTVPFRPSRSDDTRTPDGHMGELAHRLHDVAAKHGTPLAWNEINDIMRMAVYLGNRDVSQFFSPHFVDLAHGGIQIKIEELPELRPGSEVTTIQGLFKAASTNKSSPFLYKGLQDPSFGVQPENIPHFYIPRDAAGNATSESAAYPPISEYTRDVQQIKDNARITTDYFESKKVGLAVAAALATFVGSKDATIREFVDANLWEDTARPPESALSKLSDDERKVYTALMDGRGKGSLSPVEVDRAPIAGMVAGLAGKDKTHQLFEQVKDRDSFDDPVEAGKFIRQVRDIIGKEGLDTITRQLAIVARSNQHEKSNPLRADALERVSVTCDYPPKDASIIKT